MTWTMESGKWSCGRPCWDVPTSVGGITLAVSGITDIVTEFCVLEPIRATVDTDPFNQHCTACVGYAALTCPGYNKAHGHCIIVDRTFDSI